MQDSSGKNGIAILANDKVYDWLLPFLESHRRTNTATPLYVIPYDDEVARTRRAADAYGAHFVEDDLSDIDALAKRLYPLQPRRRRRLRKLASLLLPLDQVIYMDADTVLFRDFAPLFGRLERGKTEFVIASISPDYVYNRRHRDHDFLRHAVLFNDGFFSTSRALVNFDTFRQVIDADEELFHAVRKRGGLFAQPLVNFVVHRTGLAIRSLAAVLDSASDESFYKPVSAAFDPSGLPVDGDGRQIYFAHWAGAHLMPRNGIFDGLWHAYARDAAARMKA
jgi:hypothetical protein